MATSSFPKFSKLPAELRLKIWEEALPELIEQPLYFYSQRPTTCARDTPADDGSLPEGMPQSMDFRHGQVHPRAAELPHLFVNWEARRTALRWVGKQGAETLSSWKRPTHNHHVLVRPFHPETDTLYIPADLWNGFCREKPTVGSMPAYPFANYSAAERAFRHVALSVRMIQEEPAVLVHLLWHWRALEVVYLVAHEQQDDERQYATEAVEGKQLWRFEVSGATVTGTWVRANRDMAWEGSSSKENDPDLEKLRTVMLGTQPSLTEYLRIWNYPLHWDFKAQLIRVARHCT